jgi:hypothetical protein
MATDVPAHLAEAVATARAFAAAAGAERVVLLVDRGDDRPAAMVECDELGAVEVAEDEDRWALEPGTPVGAQPRPLPELRPPPPTALYFDPETAELEAPLGAVANLARGVLALAAALGGRSVASVDFPTRDPQLALTIAGRDGDPVVVAAGEQRFELPPGVLG